MRFVTFESDRGQRPGLLADEQFIVDLPEAFALAGKAGLIAADAGQPESLTDIIAGGEPMARACQAILAHAGSDALAPARHSAATMSLLAPIQRSSKNVFCVGGNYRAHVAEASRAQATQDKAPEYPVFFTKPPTAVIGPGGAIRLDPSVSEKMDYEVELGVVIGKAGRNIPAVNAVQHIFGFTIINDVTARDLQRRHRQFLKGKGLDTSCPMGPEIVTIDALPNFQNLAISLKINGATRQNGNTGDMIFPIDRLLESLSQGLTLEPGDILATGTPAGVGYAMDPPIYLSDGDTITCEIEGIGQLTNTVRDAAAADFAA